MKVAVFGCLHGLLNEMYQAVSEYEKQNNNHVDFILVCGDCQTVRHYDDLKCLAVPGKYRRIGDFHEYYSGKKRVPKLTIFVGGNHEASNYLMTLPYGGWVCDNFYYLGYAGVINYKGLRIAGISGIYNSRDCNRGRFERMPLDENSKRSIYHCRRLDVFRLQLLSKKAIKDNPIDVFLSHDWPARIYNHGDLQQLLRFKPHFRSDVDSHHGLGNPLTEPLVHQLQPRRWFAAHLHCKFYAKVEHEQSSDLKSTGNNNCTEFLSLNKIERGRRFVEFIDIVPMKEQISVINETGVEETSIASDVSPIDNRHDITDDKVVEPLKTKKEDNNLYYDAEWLTILRKTIDLENSSWEYSPCPDLETGLEYTPNNVDIQRTIEMMNRTGGMIIKQDFQMSEPVVYNRANGSPPSQDKNRCKYFPNPQHEELCTRLEIKCHLHQESSGGGDRHDIGNDNIIRPNSGHQDRNIRYRNNHNRNQTHNQTNASSSQHGGTNRFVPRYGHQQPVAGGNQPTKKRAFELDEDGCLPCYVDRKGES